MSHRDRYFMTWQTYTHNCGIAPLILPNENVLSFPRIINSISHGILSSIRGYCIISSSQCFTMQLNMHAADIFDRSSLHLHAYLHHLHASVDTFSNKLRMRDVIERKSTNRLIQQHVVTWIHITPQGRMIKSCESCNSAL